MNAKDLPQACLDEARALQELAERGIRIPAQPRVLEVLQQALADEATDFREVAAEIAADAGLSAMLFKVAGSPLFCKGRPPGNLGQVLARLGLRQVLSIARAVAFEHCFPEENRSALRVYWRRSRELATLAAIIAQERVSVCNVFPEQAYTAAVFLECGVPVLMQRFPEYCRALLERNEFLPPRVGDEDRRFNVDHCSIGYLVARHWHLPDFVAQAILHHYDFPGDEIGATRPLLAILHLAYQAHCRHYHLYNPEWPRYGSKVLQELGIHEDDLPGYLGDVIEQFLERD